MRGFALRGPRPSHAGVPDQSGRLLSAQHHRVNERDPYSDSTGSECKKNSEKMASTSYTTNCADESLGYLTQIRATREDVAVQNSYCWRVGRSDGTANTAPINEKITRNYF
jgi:hypothetical protein